MRILIVEDDSTTAQHIELLLRTEGMKPYTTDLGEEAVDLARIYDYDAITLDMTLPDMTGIDVIRTLRAAKIRTPILVLTGTSDIAQKVNALSIGADDYLTKPFHGDELIARLHALIRRSKGHTSSMIAIGALSLNLAEQVVKVNDRPLHLTGKEYGVLELLVMRRGSILTKDAFLNRLYGGMDEPELKIIDVFVCKVRRKLSDAGMPGLIQTVWGRGYVISADQEAPANTSTEEAA